ncbi:MAG: hypothetical protein LBR83_01405 [Clostridiales bacterium]|nr:hypothetical protein [Clostridiales bacterium]
MELRLYADRPVTGKTTGTEANRIRRIFEKWFSNKISTIHFDREGKWDAAVKVAAKVDLTDWDTKQLFFYYYNPKLNRYTRIAKPEYWIDANGYLHFKTEYAGDIIISEGELERRQEPGA